MFCFFANDLALHDESEEDLRMMMRNLVEVCKTKVLKVSADKSDKNGVGRMFRSLSTGDLYRTNWAQMEWIVTGNCRV